MGRIKDSAMAEWYGVPDRLADDGYPLSSIPDPYKSSVPEPYIIKTLGGAGKTDRVFEAAWDNGVDVPAEMFDFIDVMVYSARTGKYPANNWLKPDGINSDYKSMHASMFRHAAESSCGNRKDDQTGLDPLLHLACRALMMHTRLKRGLK